MASYLSSKFAQDREPLGSPSAIFDAIGDRVFWIAIAEFPWEYILDQRNSNF